MNRRELLNHLNRIESTQDAPIEQYFQTKYVAQRLSLSPSMVRKIFRNLPGVIFVGGNDGTPVKRKYATMLIPESVLHQVIAKRVS